MAACYRQDDASDNNTRCSTNDLWLLTSTAGNRTRAENHYDYLDIHSI